MKRIVYILPGILLAMSMLAACSADAAPGSASAGGPDYMLAESNALFGMIDSDMAGRAADDALPMPAPEAAPAPGGYSLPEETGSGATLPSLITPVKEGLAEKIIYSYYADIETLEFDRTIADIDRMIAQHGAFVENSSISGRNYDTYARGGVSYRYAYFSIRVPVDQLNAVTAKLGTLGNVVNQNSNAVNITAQFTDTEIRRESLLIQEERLLDMLRQADDVEYMIALESRLSDVRYQIESLTSTLTNWQRQVDYSTLTLSISEVEEYKEIAVPHRTYWERMGDGLVSTLRGVGSFFTGLFMWLVVSAPVLIILAAVTIAIVYISRKQIRKSKAKAAEKRKKDQEACAATNMYYYPDNTPVQQPPQQVPEEQPPQAQVQGQQPPQDDGHNGSR